MPGAAREGDLIGHAPPIPPVTAGAIVGAALGIAGSAELGSGGLVSAAVAGARAASGAAAAVGGGGGAGGVVTGLIVPRCSGNVFTNGIPAARALIDKAACSLHPPVPLPIVSGSSNVFINGVPAARLGDKIFCGAVILTASGNVFIGGSAGGETVKTDLVLPESGISPSTQEGLLMATAASVPMEFPAYDVMSGTPIGTSQQFGTRSAIGDPLGHWYGRKLSKIAAFIEGPVDDKLIGLAKWFTNLAVAGLNGVGGGGISDPRARYYNGSFDNKIITISRWEPSNDTQEGAGVVVDAATLVTGAKQLVRLGPRAGVGANSASTSPIALSELRGLRDMGLSASGRRAVVEGYDLALGLTRLEGQWSLREFAASHDAKIYNSWGGEKLNMFTSPMPPSEAALASNIEFLMQRSNNIKFNLNGVVSSMDEIPAMAKLGELGGDARIMHRGLEIGNHTNWELLTILKNENFLNKATFYLDGKPVNIPR